MVFQTCTTMGDLDQDGQAKFRDSGDTLLVYSIIRVSRQFIIGRCSIASGFQSFVLSHMVDGSVNVSLLCGSGLPSSHPRPCTDRSIALASRACRACRSW